MLRTTLWGLPLALIFTVGCGAAAASALAYSVSALLITIAFVRRFQIPLSTLLSPVGPQQIMARLKQR